MKEKHWTDNFITCKFWPLYECWDETQSNSIGTCFFKQRARALCVAYGIELDRRLTLQEMEAHRKTYESK